MESLDIGCGRSKQCIVGIDLRRDSDADVIADATHLPFRDGIFDFVFSSVVIEHSPNPLIFLQEQYRVLKHGGEIQVVTDNAQWFRWTILRSGLGGIFHENYHPDHYMIFYPKNIERLMFLAGFRVSSIIFQSKNLRVLDVVFKILVFMGVVRRECIFYRFKVTGLKKV